MHRELTQKPRHELLGENQRNQLQNMSLESSSALFCLNVTSKTLAKKQNSKVKSHQHEKLFTAKEITDRGLNNKKNTKIKKTKKERSKNGKIV